MKPNLDNLLELAGYLVAMICMTVLVCLGHAEFKQPLMGLLVVVAARGTRGVLSPRRASDVPPDAPQLAPAPVLAPSPPAGPPPAKAA